jgi:hypothetical protein
VEPDSTWAPPAWVYVSRHFAADLDTAIRASMGRRGDSKYILKREEIREIELAIVRLGENEILPRKYSGERHFWAKLGTVIGACKGVPTEYVYVLYNREGSVHGYPITAELLARKEGVEI